MIGGLNHNFNRLKNQEVIDPEVRVLIAEIRSMNEDITVKTNQHEAQVQGIFEKWDKDITELSEELFETEKDLFAIEGEFRNSLDSLIVEFADDEGVLAGVDQEIN